jgi:hypothetical protein
MFFLRKNELCVWVSSDIFSNEPEMLLEKEP